jgi:UDP-galactopyranose mutase
MEKRYDYLIVGAGIYGATFACMARLHGKQCLVIDKRNHLGGNIYCENIEGINVHKYGAHIFHTSNKKVWDFANSIVEFNRYTNSPIANYKGKQYNLPFNMNTFYQMWGVLTPAEAQAKIAEQRQEALERMKADGVTEPRNLEEQAQLLIGKDIYEILIKGYTEKQWGRKCSELPAFIIKRLPVRFVHDNNYFNDRFQGIPIGGFNKLIDGLLAGVDVMTNVDFFDCQRTYDDSQHVYHCQFPTFNCQCSNILYTGKLDEYFDYQLGKLEYRTVRFEEEILDMPNFQGNAVMNFTDADVPYTRIIEHKHFEMFGDDVYKCPKTVISREYSSEWKDGMEPFYSVNDERNTSLYLQYKALANQQPGLLLGGHLAEYKYYDIAPIMEKVMGLFE